MTRRRDARDDRPVRSPRSKEENAARLADMADLSADAAEERRHYEAAIHAGTRLGELLDECIARRNQLEVELGPAALIADLAVQKYEADRAWQLAPEHREDLWKTWRGLADRFEVAVAEEAERRRG